MVFDQDDHSIRPNVASPSTSHQPALERPDDTTSVLGILSTLAKEINKLSSTLATPASSQIPAVEPAPRSTTAAQLTLNPVVPTNDGDRMTLIKMEPMLVSRR